MMLIHNSYRSKLANYKMLSLYVTLAYGLMHGHITDVWSSVLRLCLFQFQPIVEKKLAPESSSQDEKTSPPTLSCNYLPYFSFLCDGMTKAHDGFLC